MLGQQIRAWDVLDDRVLGILKETPRERFVPTDYRELAFADAQIPLAHSQSMLAPKIEGRLLQALQAGPMDQVLEIGTGTGYLTACLARLAQHVTSVDIFVDFIEASRAPLRELHVANVDLVVADALTLSMPGRFDVIAVTGSTPELDEHFIKMLRPRGRLFIVVGREPIMEACLVTMHQDGDWTTESLFETMLPPLINAERPEPFVL